VHGILNRHSSAIGDFSDPDGTSGVRVSSGRCAQASIEEVAEAVVCGAGGCQVDRGTAGGGRGRAEACPRERAASGAACGAGSDVDSTKGVSVTLRIAEGLPSLRMEDAYRVILEVLRARVRREDGPFASSTSRC
jgi:hypothetical protein